jgi:predicted nucleic acid binding AN1-type Zn finger protein
MAWNHEHVKLPTSKKESVKVFPKYIFHLILHYKKWRITNKKRAAIDEAKASDII